MIFARQHYSLFIYSLVSVMLMSCATTTPQNRLADKRKRTITTDRIYSQPNVYSQPSERQYSENNKRQNQVFKKNKRAPSKSGIVAGMPSEPGKCYGKCLIQDQYTTVIETVTTYPDAEDAEFKTEVIELQPAFTKWVKKKADRNCMSADPNDCLVWCLVEIAAVTKTVKRPINPEEAGEPHHEQIEKRVLEKKGGFTEWRQVVCADDITDNLVMSLHEALIMEGYHVEFYTTSSSGLGAATKAELVKFQRENGLPVGQLDFETLESLGIEVEQ